MVSPEPQKPGRKPNPVPESLAEPIRELAKVYPCWGYKHIAMVARRAGLTVSNKLVYRGMKAAGLLQKRRMSRPQLYQTARLFELLSKAVNELWRADVTYLHIPGHGWWEVRPHWEPVPTEGGDPLIPADVYVHGQTVGLPKCKGWAKAARKKLQDMTEGFHFPHPLPEGGRLMLTKATSG